MSQKNCSLAIDEEIFMACEEIAPYEPDLKILIKEATLVEERVFIEGRIQVSF